jgi:hypothetical protein
MAGWAMPLDVEEHEQHHQRDRNHEGLEGWRRHLQPLDGGEHRNRWRHHAIAIEHRRPEDTDDHHQPRLFRLVLNVAQRQCDQRHDAAFAAVVGTHDETDVLDRNDDDQRPEEQRQAAVDVGFGDGNRMVAGEDFLDGIKRTRADVAIDHSQRGKGEHGQTLTGGLSSVQFRAAHRLSLTCRRLVRRSDDLPGTAASRQADVRGLDASR